MGLRIYDMSSSVAIPGSLLHNMSAISGLVEAFASEPVVSKASDEQVIQTGCWRLGLTGGPASFLALEKVSR